MEITVGIIVGIAAGGVLVLCAICMLVIWLVLRAKHKRKLAQINAGAEEGISRLPQSNMRITDEDVARMPGTRVGVRYSLQDRNRRSLYTPMSSRETLESRPVVKSLERVKQINRTDGDSVVPMWPLPRRCIRSDGSPLSKKTSPSTRKRSDSVWNSSPNKGIEESSKYSQEGQTRPSSFDIIQNKANDDRPPNPKPKNSPKAVDKDAGHEEDLKPPPLFHDKRRSKSYGNIFQMVQRKKDVAGLYVSDTCDREAQSVPRGTQSVPRRTHVPRSMSVCSQDPGAAPTHLLPPLPFQLLPKQEPRVKSPTDFSGGGSLFSDNTSILDEEESKILSHAETDLTSICLSSPFLSSPVSESTPKISSLWSTSTLREKASPISVSKSLKQRPQLSSKKSSSASVEHGPAASTDSDLSMSLLDPVFRTASTKDKTKRKSRANSKSTMDIPGSSEKKKIKRRTSPSSPLRSHPDFDIHEDSSSPDERLSTGIRGPDPDQQGDSHQLGEQDPSSTALENPFLWDPYTSLPAAKPTDGVSGHHRHNCVRISNIPLHLDSPKRSRVEELRDSSQETAVKHTVVRKPNMTFRPPSRATFDVHYTPPGHLRAPSVSPPDSPTLSTIHLDDYEETSSPVSAISTPTRKPSHRLPSSTHPNRTKSIFDNLPTNPWPLPDLPTNAPTSDNFNPPPPAEAPTETSPTPSSRPPSSMFHFPDPPTRPFPPNWRAPKTPIRGPRAFPSLPHPFNTTQNANNRRSVSRSPSRSPFKGISKPYNGHNNGHTNKTSFDLRNSIAQLRRQNSEVCGGDGKGGMGRGGMGHRRYLSIGEDVFGGGEGGKENAWVGWGKGEDVRGGRRREEVETPQSFYDGEEYFGEV